MRRIMYLTLALATFLSSVWFAVVSLTANVQTVTPNYQTRTENPGYSYKTVIFNYFSDSDMILYAVFFTVISTAALVVLFVVLLKNRRINKNLDKTVELRTSELEMQTAILEKRLEQQRLMANLSQNFITGGDLDEKITESLRLIGEFLSASRVILMKYEDQSFYYLNEWDNPSGNIHSKLGTSIPISEADVYLITAYSQRAISHFSLDDTDSEDLIRRYKLEDIKNFLMLPIYVGDDFWGVLEFDKCEEYSKWTASDVDLGEMVAGILSGVMASRKMEDELLQLSSIVENSPQFITIVRTGGGFAYYNPAAIEISGYTKEELNRGGLGILLSEENYRKLREEIVPIIVKNQKHTYELSFITKSGETRVMSVSAFCLKSDANMMCSIASDITNIRLTQLALNKRLEQQSLMTSISQSFLSDTDIDTLVTNALHMVGEFMEIAQILCYKMEDDGVTFSCQNEWINPKLGLSTRIGGKMQAVGPMLATKERMSNDRDFYMSSNNPEFKSAMAPYRVNFENYITTPLYLKDKMYGVMDFSKESSEDEWSESDINLAMLVSSLLSGFFERHFMESELIAAKELAEEGSRSKSDFLSRMSHEIRTPLNAVIGMVNIAMGTGDNSKIQSCLVKADNASKHLLGVINDILDMSKIEADKFELDCREFEFEKMLINVTNVINFRAEEKLQNFIVNLGGNVPAYIVGDDLRLSQVLTNLLTNAVKFTPERGKIALSISKIEDCEDEVVLRVEVEDNGIGISQEQQKRLFTSFEQADGGIARKFGGTGLGLAISKRIVELMGGTIWIESELGKGAKFIFTMRAGKGTEKTSPNLSSKINRDEIRILAVDNSAEIRDYFTRVMKSLNLPCDTAASGAEALKMIADCGEMAYNIFFVDWRLTEINGIELAKQIKKASPGNSVVFIISATEWNAIEEEARTAGVRSFISKPLFPSTLVNAVNECIAVPKKTEAGAENPGAAPHRYFGGHTILIAEDVEINREIMSAVLEDTQVSIDYAENGSAAVSMFSADPGKYSLILMDIHMPEMDGYEATRRIRALELPHSKDIPIVAMTANVFREDIEKCLSVGMNDHIGKPIDPDNLFAKLEQYMPERDMI